MPEILTFTLIIGAKRFLCKTVKELKQFLNMFEQLRSPTESI